MVLRLMDTENYANNRVLDYGIDVYNAADSSFNAITRYPVSYTHLDVYKRQAHYVAAKIKAANPTPEKPFVLGCPTGSSPLGMYKELIYARDGDHDPG